MLEIYTDGACRNNGTPDAQGGWGVFIPSLELGYSGGEFGTTNNRMEMTACIQALKLAQKEGLSDIKILTDSKYVVDGLTNWINGWKRSGRFNSTLKNFDLWEELDELYSLVRPTLQWVRGHNGLDGNERADELSVYGIDNPAALAHPNVKPNQKFGLGDKAFYPTEASSEVSVSSQVLQTDEDLTSLFDDFECQSQHNDGSGWEVEFVNLVAAISKIAEQQLAAAPKKALQSMKMLRTLTTKAQDFISAQSSGKTKEKEKALGALRKAQEKAHAYLSKPSVKKLLLA